MLKRKIISGLILFGINGISYAQYANVELLNNSASCDSTCSIDPNKVKVLSGQNQRTSNCGYGYTGSSLEDRIVKPDGSWGEWRVVNRDNCICSPLVEEQEVSCPPNQKGIHKQTRNWTCPSVAQGEYTQWITKSNNCNYYYLSTSTEEQTVACPDKQRGTHIQTRNFETWSDGNQRNHTVWSTKSNTCDYYLTAASLTETGSTSCPAGYTGSITQIRTYDKWSDGGARNYGAWTEVSRNCVLDKPITVNSLNKRTSHAVAGEGLQYTQHTNTWYYGSGYPGKGIFVGCPVDYKPDISFFTYFSGSSTNVTCTLKANANDNSINGINPELR